MNHQQPKLPAGGYSLTAGIDVDSPVWKAFDLQMTEATRQFVARWAHLAAPRAARSGRRDSQGRKNS